MQYGIAAGQVPQEYLRPKGTFLFEVALPKRRTTKALTSAKCRIRAKARVSVDDNFEKKKEAFQPPLFKAGELALRWNQIEASILKTFEKLKKLGYIYNKGEVFIIELEKEEKYG